MNFLSYSFLIILLFSFKPTSDFKLEQNNPTLLGKWKVYRAIPIYDYRIYADERKKARKFIGQEIVFKKDSIISSIDGLREELSQVSYDFKVEKTEEYFDAGYQKYLGYKKNEIVTVSCSYYNSYIKKTDTLNVVMELFSKDTLHISFDIENLFLKKLN